MHVSGGLARSVLWLQMLADIWKQKFIFQKAITALHGEGMDSFSRY
nr:hypothetical protein [Ectobacillus funiculus]